MYMCYINKALLMHNLSGSHITMLDYIKPKLCKNVTLLLNINKKVINSYCSLLFYKHAYAV
jgi:hypothetical protein